MARKTDPRAFAGRLLPPVQKSVLPVVFDSTSILARLDSLEARVTQNELDILVLQGFHTEAVDRTTGAGLTRTTGDGDTRTVIISL